MMIDPPIERDPVGRELVDALLLLLDDAVEVLVFVLDGFRTGAGLASGRDQERNRGQERRKRGCHC